MPAAVDALRSATVTMPTSQGMANALGQRPSSRPGSNRAGEMRPGFDPYRMPSNQPGMPNRYQKEDRFSTDPFFTQNQGTQPGQGQDPSTAQDPNATSGQGQAGQGQGQGQDQGQQAPAGGLGGLLSGLPLLGGL